MNLAEATRQYQAALEAERTLRDAGLASFYAEEAEIAQQLWSARRDMERLWLESVPCL